MQLKKITFCIALAFSPGAFAAETTEAALPVVEVAGKKVQPLPALSDSALGGTNIARQRASTSDTAKLLDGQPGISLYGAGGVSSLPAIHGLADDRVRTKVDGMDLISSCPNHMNSPLSYIDPSSVGSVNVFAGIAPVSIGGDSIGGTIQVDSAVPMFATGEKTLLQGQAGVFYRSNGNAKGANLSATIASENLSITYDGAIAESGNYKAAKSFKAAGAAAVDKPGHWLAGDEAGSTAYKTGNHSLGFAFRNTNHLIDLKLGYQDIPYELYPNQRMDMLDNIAHRFNLRYLGQLDWGVLEARAYQEKVDHFMDFGVDKQFLYGTAPNVAPGMPMYTKGKTSGASVKAEIGMAQQYLLRVGGDYQSYRLDDWWPPSPPDQPAFIGGMSPNTFWNINGGKRDRLGLFAETETNWNTQWLSLLGIRAEQVKMDTGPVQGYNNAAAPSMYYAGYLQSATNFNALNRQRTDNNLDLTALARYIPDDNRTFEFGYAQKTRSPNLYERYSWSRNAMALIMNNFVGDGNGYLGDPDLQPEVAHTLSATGDWHDAGRTWEFKATPYYTRVSDYIDAVQWNRTTNLPLTPAATRQFLILKHANQSARLYGLDVSGHFLLAKTDGWGEFTASGVMNYVNGKNQTTGDDLYNIMPLNMKLAVAQKLGLWSNRVELQLVKRKNNVSDARQEMQTPGYGLVNLRASYEWKQARFDLGIENLFDKFYSLPLGGGYAGQGATMSLAGIPWGVPVPGMGRSLYAGATVKF
ncbi:MAG: TonB-dependent receptor [Nitrosomonadales bacterium]|nr:TonB-dependent receptor [Nitrosomonadales bacterium]